MALVDARAWIDDNFKEGSKPDLRTVREWVINKHVPGLIIGPRKVYIDEQAWHRRREASQPMKISSSHQASQIRLTGDPRIDRILLSS